MNRTIINKIPKRFNREQRITALTHEGSKIMLAVFDMQDKAGMTDLELLDLLSEQVNRMIQRLGRKK